ncbi:MAG: CapA family protein [archaeon]
MKKKRKIVCFTIIYAIATIVLIILVISLGKKAWQEESCNKNQLGNSQYSILILGDTSFRDYCESRSIIDCNEKEFSLFFSKIFENFSLLLNESDYSIANLEAPITTLKESPYGNNKSFVESDNPQVTPYIFKKYKISAVSLANNHMMDFKEEGLKDTLRNLGQAKISLFGAGFSSIDAAEPLNIDISSNGKTRKIFVFSAFDNRTSYEQKYNFYAKKNKAGVLSIDDSALWENIRQIRKKEPESFIILLIHWGEDYEWMSQRQKQLATQITKSSDVNLIIGHGSHTLQQVDFFNDTYVVYGIGNFFFNSIGRYSSMSGFPYSFITRLIIQSQNNSEKIFLRLYPFKSDNAASGFKPRLVNSIEFKEVLKVLSDKSANTTSVNDFVTGIDRYGYYIEFDI